ncbi:hypothetical protein ACFOWM_03495 [Ferruginibacter yonginensis]|uniref:Uncharacterized protein n=1 Tax=Ferruginibacter yonginensis TaxID=1310416 RepID=A0ABV8QRC2_9BACT
MLTSSEQINDEVLKQIETMGACYFDPMAIALALEIDKDLMRALMQDENSAAYRAYYKGFYTSEFEHRKSIIDLAKSGSSPAQTMVSNILEKAKLKLLDHG